MIFANNNFDYLKTTNLVRKNILVVRVMQSVGALHCIFARLLVDDP